jgi:catechol 2,3-dioxygenase-like lactoylglutathione lyase family enzyme
MPIGRLEHTNLTVSDNVRLASLLADLCNWHFRWQGKAQNGGETIHIGSDAGYLALWTGDTALRRYRKGQPLNHVGLEVDDLAAAEAVVVAAGLQPYGHDDYVPGKRFYFFDWDGIEFEVVSYADTAT